MWASMKKRAPNPRLQRTPLRAPLSRKPLGHILQVLGKVVRWFSDARQWHRDHEAAWQGASTPGPDSLSSFQRECEQRVTEALLRADSMLVGRNLEIGQKESFLTAMLGATDIRIWIYADGAQLSGPGIDLRFEEWDALTPRELAEEVAAAARELVEKKRGGVA
jgi:hypothetical protein